MKPFAHVLTYADQPTRAFAEEADAQRELQRLNSAYKSDRARRELVPVYSQAQVEQLLDEQARSVGRRRP
jgi:hypothetical protein